MRRAIITMVAFMILAGACFSDDLIFLTPQEAQQITGDRTQVCGKVARAWYAAHSKAQTTYLTLERAYQNKTLTVMIQRSVRATYTTPPEKLYAGKTVCISGKVTWYRGQPELIVSSASQISLQGTDQEVTLPVDDD